MEPPMVETRHQPFFSHTLIYPLDLALFAEHGNASAKNLKVVLDQLKDM